MFVTAVWGVRFLGIIVIFYDFSHITNLCIPKMLLLNCLHNRKVWEDLKKIRTKNHGVAVYLTSTIGYFDPYAHIHLCNGSAFLAA